MRNEETSKRILEQKINSCASPAGGSTTVVGRMRFRPDVPPTVQ